MRNVIEIEGLGKHYRRRARVTAAVDGLDLVVPEGGVFGFLGPNGSGKTTTIRCVLGLTRPTAGSVRLLGCRVPGDVRDAVRRTGAIVETPASFPTMTARENLRLLASIDGIGRRRVDEVLEEVGLGERAGDLVKRFSLGMRQRLALASVLLKDPELLILDEPANGLDPAGMREVRRLLRRLGDEGRTVFVSSHVLAEIEATCDRVAILSAGRCVIAGTVDDVVDAVGGGTCTTVRVDDPDAGARALRTAGYVVEQDGPLLRVAVASDAAADLTRVLAAADQWVSELRPERFTLEDVFLQLTGVAPGSDVARDDGTDEVVEVVA